MNYEPLYSIGHGTRKADDFILQLQKNAVKVVADVRSRPYSRFNPQFNQKALRELLENNEIRYIFMGDTLGGRPDDPSCYTNGKINYDLLKEKEFFKRGMEELLMISQNERTAVMCSERKPENCHRSLLIGNVLPAELQYLHIDEQNNLKLQEQLGKLNL